MEAVVGMVVSGFEDEGPPAHGFILFDLVRKEPPVNANDKLPAKLSRKATGVPAKDVIECILLPTKTAMHIIHCANVSLSK